MVGAALGYPVELVMPGNVSKERKEVVAAFGAKAIFSDPLEGSDGAIRLCRTILAEHPTATSSPTSTTTRPTRSPTTRPPAPRSGARPRARSRTSSPPSAPADDHGTGRYLKEQNRSIQVIAAEPADAFHGIEGLKHMASSIVPGIYHEAELDRKLGIETEDAYNMVYRLGREEGLLLGQSSGAAQVRRSRWRVAA